MKKRKRTGIAFTLVIVIAAVLTAEFLIIREKREKQNQVPSAAETIVEGTGQNQLSPTAESTVEETGSDDVKSDTTLICRIISGAETKDLILASQSDDASPGDVYRLSLDNQPADIFAPDAQLQNGMLLEITFDGSIEETYPAQFGGLSGIKPLEYGLDNLCELYLNVFEDLWEVDSGLNSDIDILGVNLSETSLTKSEQAAVTLVFGQNHGLETVQGTWQELCDQGYINAEYLYWEDGCLFSITEKPVAKGSYSLCPLSFDAEKWRSGDGAYYFIDCTSVQSAVGIWQGYKVGAAAIS